MILAPEEVQPSELLQLILRHKGALVVLAEAYFDASGTHGAAKDLCLGGYIFKKDDALAFDMAWREMLARYALPYFHMKECAHATGAFAHLGHDGCDLAAREAIGLIKKHAAQGIALSVDKSVAMALRKASPWMNEYSFIVGQVFYAVRDWAKANQLDGSVSCLFERGDVGAAQAVEDAGRILKAEEFSRDCQISMFSWASENEETPLQAADMLAWHLNLWRVKRRNGVTQRRGDFKSLLGVPTVYHHWDRSSVDALAAIRSGWGGLMAAQQRP